MSKVLAQGDFIIVEQSQILDSSFAEAKILSLGPGVPDALGQIAPIKYEIGDSVLYDARSRIGLHNDFDVIKRESVIAVVYDETN